MASGTGGTLTMKRPAGRGFVSDGSALRIGQSANSSSATPNCFRIPRNVLVFRADAGRGNIERRPLNRSARRVVDRDVPRGDRGCQPLPQSAAMQPEREKAGHAEGAGQGAELRESFEDSHCF